MRVSYVGKQMLGDVCSTPGHRSGPMGGWLDLERPRRPRAWLSPVARATATTGPGSPGQASWGPSWNWSHSCRPPRSAASRTGCPCRQLGTGSAHCCGRSLHSGSAAVRCRRHWLQGGMGGEGGRGVGHGDGEEEENGEGVGRRRGNREEDGKMDGNGNGGGDGGEERMGNRGEGWGDR